MANNGLTRDQKRALLEEVMFMIDLDEAVSVLVNAGEISDKQYKEARKYLKNKFTRI